MWGTASLGFSLYEQVDAEEGFSPSSCSTTPIQAKSFDVKINVAFVLNRVWQIVRCMFMSGSSNREAAVLKDIITIGKRSLVTRLVL